MKVEGSRSEFMGWFWRPPRPHGATIRDRVVTNLELFYDLAYVAVIGEAAHHLAEDVSARAIAEFAVVFAMIWFAWINGSLYLEMHGRQDGRTRTFVFLQMGILVLLAVFAGGATGQGGGSFALVYALLFTVMGWLWYSVRRQDEAEYRTLTGAEAQIARLVSDGSTNREIADRLFLSPHTVNSHLRHIFAKLAINSRAELARIVAEQDAGSLRQ
jgi:low temperature requirement protein LtrA